MKKFILIATAINYGMTGLGLFEVVPVVWAVPFFVLGGICLTALLVESAKEKEKPKKWTGTEDDVINRELNN